MRTRDFFIVISLVAVLLLFLPGRHSPTLEATAVATPIALAEPIASPTEAIASWSVHGIGITERTDSLVERFGPAVEDQTEAEHRFTILNTPTGEIRRTEYLLEQTAGLSGTILELDGKIVAETGDSVAEVEQRLGAPMLIRRPDGNVSYQYDGARVYFRDETVFGVVIEGEIPSR